MPDAASTPSAPPQNIVRWALVSAHRRGILRILPAVILALGCFDFGRGVASRGQWHLAIESDFRQAAPVDSETAATRVRRDCMPWIQRPLESPTEPAGMEALNNGMTWALKEVKVVEGEDFVRVGSDANTDVSQGDTPATTALPILAFRPMDRQATDLPPKISQRWSQGQLGLTAPVAGSQLISLAAADRYVVGELGEEWRMAQFHQHPRGGQYWAMGPLEADVGDRFWVFIRDQSANPWNRTTLDPDRRLLQTLPRDRLVQSCRSALTALGGLPETPSEVLDTVLEVARRQKPEGDIALVVVGLLGADAAPALDEMMQIMAGGPDARRRRAATLALGGIGVKNEQTMAALEAQILRSSHDVTTCSFAYETLRELSPWRAWRIGRDTCPPINVPLFWNV